MEQTIDALPASIVYEGVLLKQLGAYPGYYAGEDGHIYSMRIPGPFGKVGRCRATPKRLKGRPEKDGYLQVAMSPQPGQPQDTVKVATAVVTAFKGDKPAGYECCHNNGIKTDNRPSNLRWGTPEENEADKVRHGTGNKGSKHGNAKLTEENIIRIREMFTLGARRASLALEFGVARQTIDKIVTRKAWSHVS